MDKVTKVTANGENTGGGEIATNAQRKIIVRDGVIVADEVPKPKAKRTRATKATASSSAAAKSASS